MKRTGNEARAFDLVTDNFIIPCVSPDVLAEYEAVLSRPALRSHAARVTRILQILTTVAVRVTPTVTLEISKDENDNRFYECAHAANADYLVTGNRKHFPRDLPPTKIVNASQLLKIITAQTDETR